ncbi:MAG: sugar lactone lactonase YvrE [Myxococcota bacterium]|jgi:sugar lactone lactonase YvrE
MRYAYRVVIAAATVWFALVGCSSDGNTGTSDVVDSDIVATNPADTTDSVVASELPSDKADARAQAATGEPNWPDDPCRLAGWYGDGECDTFCWEPDSDCMDPTDVTDTADADAVAIGPLLDSYFLSDDRHFPESVTWDARRGAFFVGSLSRGDITRIRYDGTKTTFFAGTGEVDRLTLGLKVDLETHRLAVCTILNVTPPIGRIWIFDLETRQRTHDIDLTTVLDEGACNDVVFDASGALFVTDREHGVIYRVSQLDAPAGPTTTVWAQDALLAPAVIGQNGIALTADEDILLTTHFLPPALFRTSVSDPTDVVQVELLSDFPADEVLGGADGMIMHEGYLYVALGKSLLRLSSPDGTWRTIELDQHRLDVSISGVTVAEGQLYVLKSDVVQFVVGGVQPDIPFEIRRVDPAVFDAN